MTGSCRCFPAETARVLRVLTLGSKIKAVDFAGIFLAFAGMAVVILGLSWGGREFPWNSAHVVATLAVGAAASVAFVLWQWKGPRHPLVPRMCLLAQDTQPGELTDDAARPRSPHL